MYRKAGAAVMEMYIQAGREVYSIGRQAETQTRRKMNRQTGR